MITTKYTLMSIVPMHPDGDFISLNEAATILGHADSSSLRHWLAEGRFYSAIKPGGRDWLIAKSEIELRTDV